MLEPGLHVVAMVMLIVILVKHLIREFASPWC